MEGPRRAAVGFIFITILLDMLSIGMILPILPKLVESFADNNTADAAKIYGLFGTAWALMQFFASPVLGALSDRFGRRPVILLSNFGLGLDYIMMALAPSLGWLFVGRMISGVTSASISTSFAYIADVTAPEKRAAVFGKIGAAFGLGFIFGPAIGGLLGGVDPRLPFWVAAGLSLANAMYGYFVLPESLPKERRSAFKWRSANPLGALRLLRSNATLAALAVVTFCAEVAHVALPATFVLYTTYRYGWDQTTVGLALAFVGLCTTIVQGGLVGPALKLLGERWAMILGYGGGALGFAIYAFAPNGPLFWIGIPVMTIWGIAGPATSSLMTRLVPADQQGQLQGANTSVNSVAELVGPSLFTLIFAYFIADGTPLHLPGAPFIVAGALLLVSMLIAGSAVAAMRREQAAAQER
ncbi:DHA1 family tetracycline resistance protein-like MFS transporter [Rhodopseudomonas rhenobacensis]|uniref:DHA1 family tetracycline resistance protein-like MFS transporter n=1 Tax=Rhodopseudomonas rhenobacensis TaxID=87461 RepID=A0A7W8DY57_9BRAD|nr:TCR/Tet family MFS transporter [Rhodopseudomonas rhenobacensis]MBB5046490.1 DHA1 family tetracycline resistance protein-like MFS transporter [Rhodopseudomonas rhenobacensis]